MKLNIKIETDEKVCNDILDDIIELAYLCKAKSMEIEGLDTCEPFYTDEEIADIIKKAQEKNFIKSIKSV